VFYCLLLLDCNGVDKPLSLGVGSNCSGRDLVTWRHQTLQQNPTTIPRQPIKEKKKKAAYFVRFPTHQLRLSAYAALFKANRFPPPSATSRTRPGDGHRLPSTRDGGAALRDRLHRRARSPRGSPCATGR